MSSLLLLLLLLFVVWLLLLLFSVFCCWNVCHSGEFVSGGELDDSNNRDDDAETDRNEPSSPSELLLSSELEVGALRLHDRSDEDEDEEGVGIGEEEEEEESARPVLEDGAADSLASSRASIRS